MLPQFPNFKCLEWIDRKDIEQITEGFPPYSDFNFTSLYIWNIEDKMQVSVLNDNLVVIFTDYISSGQFLSFIGCNNTSETARMLLEYSAEYFNEPSLKLIPEPVALSLCDTSFAITADRDAFDYIYPVQYLKDMHLMSSNSNPGSRSLRIFLKQYPNHRCIYGTLCDIQKSELRSLYEFWAMEKGIDHHSTNEYRAFERLLLSGDEGLHALYIYADEMLKGFLLFELQGEFVVSHFSKSNISCKGINEILMWYAGKYLAEQNIHGCNFEQDLGIENLRRAKEKYKQHYFFKKYIVQKL